MNRNLRRLRFLLFVFIPKATRRHPRFPLVDLLRAKQDEVNAGREYIEALRDYWVARAELEKAVGGSLEGKLLRLSDNKEIAPKR